MRDVMERERQSFDLSVRDFREKASTFGWPFWRGVMVGFMAAFPLAYIAVLGDSFFGVG